jgi:choline transport protein
VFAWIATCAQPVFLLGTTIQGLIILNSDTYVPERWHGTLLAWSTLAIPVICNIFTRRVLAPVEIIGGVTHIVFWIVFVATLLAMAPRSTSSFVFTQTITGLSGWSNVGVQWNIGLLSAVFPLCGTFDASSHTMAVADKYQVLMVSCT